MSVIHNDLLLATDEGAGGYNLTKSLRFRASASASLSRTPASAGNRQKWTWSGWVKRGLFNDQQVLFCGFVDTGNYTLINTYQDSFIFQAASASSIDAYQVTTAVLRDPAAWYHIVYAVDTTQATAANRAKIYVNGVQITSFSTNTQPTQNYNTFVNATNTHFFGKFNNNLYFDGYMAEVNFIDGQQLDPTSFGENNATTGVWKPKRYTGTYGTNGFYLPFTDVATTSGSNAGLGKDFSGNGNYWNTNNISVTAGATYDSMTDVPTLTDATTANYSTLNPLTPAWYSASSLSNGNLQLTTASDTAGNESTIAMRAGKFYWETTFSNVTGSSTCGAGIHDTSVALGGSNAWGITGHWVLADTGLFYANGASGVASGTGTFSSGNIANFAFDANTGKLWVGKNGTWVGDPSAGTGQIATVTMTGKEYTALSTVYGAGSTNISNFGQRPFAYTPPTGYVALNTYNLPDSTIVAGNKVMDATTYTGTGSTLSITNAGAFKPDFLWIKTRQSGSHALIDSVRGVNKVVNSNNTDAENTSTTGTGLTSFNSNGFTLGSNNSGTGTTNYSGDTFVAWQWQAGQGSSASNTSGSITSTVSVNASAGFSIATYTGTATAATIGHGLGVAPKMIIVKRRDSAGNNIPVYHISTGAANIPYLENTTGYFTRAGNFNDTAPTSTVFSVGGTGQSDYTNTNASGGTYVAYCWSEIAGFSKFGSYTGNGSSDGTFVYLGFRPKFILFKRIDTTANWVIFDTARSTYNAVSKYLRPNDSAAEGDDGTGSGSWQADFLSNGFKLRASAEATVNPSGGTIVYAAFAENPFKNSLAR